VSKGDFSPNTMLKQDEETMIVESINNFVVEEDVQMEIGKVEEEEEEKLVEEEEKEEEEKQQEPQPPVELELTETNNETCSDKFQILLQAIELKQLTETKMIVDNKQEEEEEEKVKEVEKVEEEEEQSSSLYNLTEDTIEKDIGRL
jgi:hypothetical protein